MNPGFQLLSIRRKQTKFYLVVNRVPIGFVTAEELESFQKFLEKTTAELNPDFWEIQFPRLEQDDDTHDMYRAIGVEVEVEREACAHILDVAADTAKNASDFTFASMLRSYAAMMRARSDPPVPEMAGVNQSISEAASAGERRGQGWGLWQAFEYSAQIAEQEQHGELGVEIAAEIRKDAAEHNGNDWARVVLRAEMKGQERGAELERERLAQLMETHALNMVNHAKLEARGAPAIKEEIRRTLAEEIRARSPRPKGSYPFTEREIAAHILRSIGDELWAIGRRNQPPLAVELQGMVRAMRQWALELKKGGEYVDAGAGQSKESDPPTGCVGEDP